MFHRYLTDTNWERDASLQLKSKIYTGMVWHMACVLPHFYPSKYGILCHFYYVRIINCFYDYDYSRV